MSSKKVEIVVTSIQVGTYEARSYPNDQTDANGYYPLYEVPVHKIQVKGIDANNRQKTVDFKAPRFMPYFNDPNRPDPHYRTKGWVNAGLSSARTVTVSQYKRDYEVRNRFSPGRGAIVVQDTFYIHAGPASPSDVGFGSAGCIEIIGNYDDFKRTIAELSGIPNVSSDQAIQQLINARNLIVVVQPVAAPDIRSKFTRKVKN